MTVYLAEIGGYEESETVGIFSTDEKAVAAVRHRWLDANGNAREDAEPGERVTHHWYRDDVDRPTYYWATITTYEIDGDGEP